MQEQKLERITPAQAGLDPQCIINMMDRMEKERLTLMKRSQIYLQRKLKTERFR